MLFRNQVGGMMHMKRINRFIILQMVVALVLAFSACSATKGSIVINEKPFGAQFDIAFNEWSGHNKCQMSLNKGDEIQVEIVRESGEVSLAIRGKTGSEPYMGNHFDSGTFTVTVPGTDGYVIQLSGDKATGKIVLTNLSK